MVGVGLSLGVSRCSTPPVARRSLHVPPVGSLPSHRDGVAPTTSPKRSRSCYSSASLGVSSQDVQLGIIPSPDVTDPGGSPALPRWPCSYTSTSPALLVAAGSFYYIRRQTQASVDKGIKTVLVVLGSVVAFSSGGSQVGLATGPLENLYATELGLPGFVLLTLGAVGILGGAWMGAPRLLQATSREYAQLGIRRSIAALSPASDSRPPSQMGIPAVQHVIICGVIGGSLAADSAGVLGGRLANRGFWS